MGTPKLDRYIKQASNGEKVESHTTSVNIEKIQREFLKANNINLSLLVRDAIAELMKSKK